MFGLSVAMLALLLVACAFGGLALEAGAPQLLAEFSRPLTREIIRFTAFQAALSALLSAAFALPLACALARRRFRGRGALIMLGGVALVIPSMVAVIGLVAVHGRGGWVGDALAAAGFARRDYLYGLTGILLAHVFFNMPLAARIFLNGLLALPQSARNLAVLYGLQPRHVFRRIEWPLLRAMLPGVCGMMFLLCFTSFAVVLTLGGGPKSTTLEVAIYQAVRFDFDLAKAVALSLIQIALCLLCALVFFAGGAPFPLRAGDAHAGDECAAAARFADSAAARVIDFLVIAAAALFLLSPLAALFAKALNPRGWTILLEPAFWHAVRWTLLIALAAGALSCMLALAVCDVLVTLRMRGGRMRKAGALAAEIAGLVTLLAPPITLGAGLFLFFRRFTDALSLGPALVVALNALLALAFGIRIVLPALRAERGRVDALCATLGIGGLHRWRVLWPALRAPIAYALAVATALSAGDMGVIALFGTDELRTLPLLIYRLLGAYRLEQAATAAAALCALCFALFWLIERVAGGAGRGHA
ncbi:MAG: ABC transporter permease subunit [Gammaproteobacteria bacterium]